MARRSGSVRERAGRLLHSQSKGIHVRIYEGMFILHNRDPGPSAEVEEGAEAPKPATPEEVVSGLIEKVSGTVHHSQLWANRKLSYPIAGNQTGSYVLTYFTCDDHQAPVELDREVRLNDRLLRHMLITVDELPGEDDVPGPLSEPQGRRTRADLDMPLESADGEKPPKVWEMLDYKNPQVLRRMISAQGKLFSRVRTNLEGKSQRRLRREVFRARNMALLPFVGR